MTQLTWFGRGGDRLGTLGEPAEWVGFAPSPTGREMVLERHDPRRGEVNLWLMDGATGTTSALSPELELREGWRAGTAVWSPAGDRVFFATFPGVAAQSLRGGAADELCGDFAWVTDVSPDGGYLLLERPDPATNGDLWLLPLHGERKPRPYLVTRHTEWGGRISPDGRWVAYASDESGRYEVYVRSFPESGRPVRVSEDGGTMAEWRGDGREIVYVAPDGMLRAAAVDRSGAVFRASRPRPLFRVATMSETRRQIWASADGQRFLVNARLEDTTRQVLTVLLDWKAVVTRDSRGTPP